MIERCHCGQMRGDGDRHDCYPAAHSPAHDESHADPPMLLAAATAAALARLEAIMYLPPEPATPKIVWDRPED